MSYTPTTWATGDVITADKLNNMEQGILNAGSGGGGAGGGVVTYTFTVKEGDTMETTQVFDIVETDAVPSDVVTSMLAGNVCIIKWRLQWEDDDTGQEEYGNWEFGVFNKLKDYNKAPTSLFLTFYNGTLSTMAFQGDSFPGTDRPWTVFCTPIA